jgi:hypothetical protein
LAPKAPRHADVAVVVDDIAEDIPAGGSHRGLPRWRTSRAEAVST